LQVASVRFDVREGLPGKPLIYNRMHNIMHDFGKNSSPQQSPLKINVLVICTGNSCRSQIAEGLLKYINGELLEVSSAGIETHGLNAKAVAVMAEVVVDISKQTSDILTYTMIEKADLIITVCKSAKTNLPPIPEELPHLHWAIQDPAKTTGTEDEIISSFREVREVLNNKIAELFGHL
jgi:arsenate reductase (thioredoxin)